jgi:hypothetical protein
MPWVDSNVTLVFSMMIGLMLLVSSFPASLAFIHRGAMLMGTEVN